MRIITGDKEQYAIIEKYLRELMPDERKYREFEMIMEELANRIKENQDEK